MVGNDVQYVPGSPVKSVDTDRVPAEQSVSSWIACPAANSVTPSESEWLRSCCPVVPVAAGVAVAVCQWTVAKPSRRRSDEDPVLAVPYSGQRSVPVLQAVTAAVSVTTGCDKGSVYGRPNMFAAVRHPGPTAA